MKYDALVIGAGPAGASAAILLAQAGWQVSLIEQHVFPRQKVCGECIAAGNLALLDELGVGTEFRRLAGPPLSHVGWMRGSTTVTADMPAGPQSIAPYGRALGRDVFDALLLERARAVGVRVWQPARAREISGVSGGYDCKIEHLGIPRASSSPSRNETISTSIIIDAHGSWEPAPVFDARNTVAARRPLQASDLFAFKATFRRSRLAPGLLPVVALRGGYGGFVVANEGRTTVALCVRRDLLRAIRARGSGLSAGLAVEAYLRQSCDGVRSALEEAHRDGSWLTVGPLQPGDHLHEVPGIFPVGNAAGESHPLIGEGISMALQSSKLLVESLRWHADTLSDATNLRNIHQAYANAWRTSFLPRLRLAALYAQVAMRAQTSAPVNRLLRQWPGLLTTAARVAGKARSIAEFQHPSENPL